jgi:hypothetical protein
MDRLGFDLDGVLYSWTEVVYRELVDHHGLTIPYDAFWTNQQKGDDPYSKVFWDNLVRIPTFCSALKADPIDVAILNVLASKYEIYYITSRPEDVRLATQNWLIREKFPTPRNLILGKSKVDAIKELNIKYYVEDLSKYVDVLKDLTTVIMKRQPWNEAYIHSPKITSISELIGILP